MHSLKTTWIQIYDKCICVCVITACALTISLFVLVNDCFLLLQSEIHVKKDKGKNGWISSFFKTIWCSHNSSWSYYKKKKKKKKAKKHKHETLKCCNFLHGVSPPASMTTISFSCTNSIVPDRCLLLSFLHQMCHCCRSLQFLYFSHQNNQSKCFLV